ncbi:unnamed protein product [Lactuca virosa]|uniref:U-box domain-containing protein n=1 Tax=Lactuca virosa TaxID=75947 RepID=A0AAU9NFH7_9ASTR|nr:unnamed protein product [Lactuca virosa]
MFEVAEPIQMISIKPHLLKVLTQILANQISQKATKAALKLLIGVCPWGRNRIKAVEAGVVSVLIDTLLDCTDQKRVPEMVLTLLDHLCQCADGRAELLKHGAGLAVVSKKIFRVSQVVSSRAVRILHAVAKFSGNTSVVHEMLQLGVVGKLCFVLQVECGSKTSEKASEILKMHARAWKNSSCILYELEMVVIGWFSAKARHLWPVFTVVSGGDDTWNKCDGSEICGRWWCVNGSPQRQRLY